ncbi:LytR/AlgR family response regulator transcription factor [Synoicihabitans lomoniglobus]|uniref:LytTR family DNA-binding domain-containing protein n=1 Tax=Synoicihabitans lomoniglobus TaxID=2909285 RepID=A0AAF0CMM9_9BACT|nr:LytTR family DNA-binding domain-containing protein [Opitutaceae bacterium LMO-M01]WED63516.1 LytTR family DNA-binding domain-containing protein [Opitutaceae bacterium LMO-M01]
MKPIRCLVVDDEPLAQRVIENFARSLPHLQIVRKCNNAVEALDALHTEKDIDVIFLDIQMPRLSGLSFARSLKHAPPIIFTTAFAEHALESYDLEAVDYLKKPFSFERFCQALEKVQRRMEVAAVTSAGGVSNVVESRVSAATSWADQSVFIKAEGAMVRVDLADILLIEGVGDYVKLVRRNSTLISHETLQQWERRLPSDGFVRVHKSFIVAVGQIDAIKGGEILIEERWIPIGRVYRAALDAVIGTK